MASSRQAASSAHRRSRAVMPREGPFVLRLPKPLVDLMRRDLRRPHPFAFERVGFLSVTTAEAEAGERLVLGVEYHAVPDAQYVESRGVGARIGVEAIRGVVHRAMTSGNGIVHVHLHDHQGVPAFSGTDALEQPMLVKSLAGIAARETHGMLVLSADSANAWLWSHQAAELVVPTRLSIVGYPMILLDAFDLRGVAPRRRRRAMKVDAEDRYDRQSFLGPDGQRRLGLVRLGLLGYGGGGSHVGQQAAHIGIGEIRVADGDEIDESNLNRLVGGTERDVRIRRRKVDIAKRIITAVNRSAQVEAHPGRWQDRAELFRGCDVVVGCVDSFAERRDLEVLSRRFLVPYIDIGMDLHAVHGAPPQMAGQVFLSMPGDLCMACVGFLTEARLAQEAALYGAAGKRPQVVWPNGILASAAVGVLVDLITGWSGQMNRRVYLAYDGNAGTLVPHPRLALLTHSGCAHFPLASVGLPSFRKVR